MPRLPPFFSLRALEAAARHGSYSRAAKELSVTHGAVSQQIRRLEAELGARLFERRGNAMVPTPAAARLARRVGEGMDLLHNAVAEFTAAAERDPLVLSLDSQFASRWLPSRLARLLTDPAGANLEIRVDDRLADFTTDGVDVAVRYGAGR
jgi:LysR family glycine cleavage system transcriptional activator